jgi:tetratricopeptide (TPR) repeat protein
MTRSWPGRAAGLAVVLTVAGCATPDVMALRGGAQGLPPRAEVAGVPFHPQKERYCGPAALATALGWSGLATRQDALASEVAAGHPVVVLQNLGLGWYPQWHFAVAVGYDLSTNELALRSGDERRRMVALDTFSRTWARAGRWALVVLPPDQLPASGNETLVLSAAAGLERVGRFDEVALAYDAILRRWPASLGALIGRGNARYALGDLAGAEAAYRAALQHHPGAAVAWNNLADVLAAQGARDEALIAARRAVDLGGAHAEVYQRTLEEISGERA